jgi:hypothetical protein
VQFSLDSQRTFPLELSAPLSELCCTPREVDSLLFKSLILNITFP